ncbi:protein of unknown function [Nocardiopsis flavescens]|uniref:DUF4037 domain-containing protein n=1 Tax=Nocardiopsis flavescens TaxID=758803 RepID=A0A1M6AUU9_9ACTN|nr:DUF4037 domain-containing protein [Nocardiopsis flavescens]SHI40230.1 protein of unknown function [Nocardiopsis flavescens]
MSTPAFLPGLELAHRFYHEAVRPLLEEAAPATPHSAALLGPGSEVLGFDTPRSRDHDWGPRLQIFLTPRDTDRHGPRLHHHLAQNLPADFLGHPVRFAPTGQDPHTDTRHHVEITDPTAWFTAHLGLDPTTGVTPADWLATPTQLLAQATAGAVFHDGLHRLAPARLRLRWYPRDLWLHVLACQWRRLAQEEAFVGRCAEVGDDLGATVVTARLVRDLMRLHLLMHRRYPPYSKWLGTAFTRTPAAAGLTPHLKAALTATDHPTREHHLCLAYERTAREHNRLGLTDPVDPSTRPFHNRPFRVLGADRLAAALRSRITDPALRELPEAGAVDQYVDSTDVLTRPHLARATALAPPPRP